MMNTSAAELTHPRSLSPFRFGLGVGTVGIVFYIGGLITVATVSRDTAVLFFNNLPHGLGVTPVLRESVSFLEGFLGIVSTFILGWVAGVIIAGVYNCCLKASRK